MYKNNDDVLNIVYKINERNPVLGVFMLMAYSIGNSILVIVAGVSVSTLNSLVTQPKYIKLANNLKNILALPPWNKNQNI